MKKFYIISFKVFCVNSLGETIIDKLYQKTIEVPKIAVSEPNKPIASTLFAEEQVLTETTLNSLANKLVLEITNNLANQQLTKEMQNKILPDWDKSSITPIGIIPIYANDEPTKEENNDKNSSNI